MVRAAAEARRRRDQNTAFPVTLVPAMETVAPEAEAGMNLEEVLMILTAVTIAAGIAWVVSQLFGSTAWVAGAFVTAGLLLLGCFQTESCRRGFETAANIVRYVIGCCLALAILFSLAWLFFIR